MIKRHPKTKACSQCSLRRGLGEFYKNKSQADGLNNWCKPCHSEYAKTWRKDNRDRLTLNQRKWRENNLERARNSTRKWRKHNKQKHYPRGYQNYKAGYLFRYLIASDKTKRPKECSICQSDKSIIHGHHNDYSKPYEVEWLCVSYHGFRHRKEIVLET